MQRAALGRAIVRQPKVFLMDEPLSNLDAKLRMQMRGELKRLQRELAITTLYVTHVLYSKAYQSRCQSECELWVMRAHLETCCQPGPCPVARLPARLCVQREESLHRSASMGGKPDLTSLPLTTIMSVCWA